MSISSVVKNLRSSRSARAGNRLFSFVNERTFESEESLVQPLQPGDTVRASSLGRICVREECLASKYDVIRVRHDKPHLKLTWKIGHLFHDMYRNDLFGPMQEWAGAWKCVACGWDTDDCGLSKPPTNDGGDVDPGKIARMPCECPKCGRKDLIVFKEWLVRDVRVGIHGHPDGWSWQMGSKRILVDLKSQGFRDFSISKSVKDDHRVQLLAYMHLCGDRFAEVWYANKSPWGDALNFVRDLSVEWDAMAFDVLVRKKVDALMNALAGGVLPDRMCIGPEFPRARECQLADVCF